MIAAARERMSVPQLRLWEAIHIAQEKWAQHPFGDESQGFWVVAVMGRIVVWYNDIEEGFNCSHYSRYGVIDEYWCNQDELEMTVQQLVNVIGSGQDTTLQLGPSQPA